MSGVNGDYYIHYYIQQQNTSIAQSETFLSSPAPNSYISQLTQGGSKVRRSCQSTIVGGACAELHHSDCNIRTAWFEKGDFKIGIQKKHWVDFYHYRVDVYTHFQHTFMFKQLEKWIKHPMTPLKETYYLLCSFLQDVKKASDIPRVFMWSFSSKYQTDIFLLLVKIASFRLWAKTLWIWVCCFNANELALPEKRAELQELKLWH